MYEKNIIVFGECMVELSGSPLSKRFGGDTLNTALYLTRILQNHPFTIRYATGLGNDMHSSSLIDAWQAEGIRCDLVATIDGKQPGLYIVETDANGERSFHYWRSDSAAKYYFEQHSPLEQAVEQQTIDMFYLSGISLAILSHTARDKLLATIAKMKTNNTIIVFDNNYREALWSADEAKLWYEKVLKYTDIALITGEDDYAVWGDQEIIQRCTDFGCQQVVIKRGGHPCTLVENLQSQQTLTNVAPIKVEKVVDTCSAGDAFAAGYLSGYLTGQSAQQRLHLAHQTAATVIQYPGAITPKSAITPLEI